MGYGNYINPFAGTKAAYEVEAGQKLELDFLILPGESRKLRLDIDMKGPGAEAVLRGIYLSGADEEVGFDIVLHHRAPGCKSRQIFKGIAGGKASVRFDGRIIVAPGADRTEAFQENHNILLSETARVETSPQLEIYADDVKCSHGATVGRLDEEELFYMRSRGIPEKEARALQIISFLSDAIPSDEKKLKAIEAAVRSLL